MHEVSKIFGDDIHYPEEDVNADLGKRNFPVGQLHVRERYGMSITRSCTFVFIKGGKRRDMGDDQLNTEAKAEAKEFLHACCCWSEIKAAACHCLGVVGEQGRIHAPAMAVRSTGQIALFLTAFVSLVSFFAFVKKT